MRSELKMATCSLYWVKHIGYVPSELMVYGRRFCAVSYLAKRLSGKGVATWQGYALKMGELALLTEQTMQETCAEIERLLRPVVFAAVNEELTGALAWRNWKTLPAEVIMTILQFNAH